MIGGVFAAMLTPLKDDGAVDDAGLSRLALWLLANGCDGVVLFGTTGEFPSFTLEERNVALDRLIEGGVPAAKVIVGTGCPAVRDTVAASRYAARHRCAGVLVVPPYYFKDVMDEGLFGALAQTIEGIGGKIPIFLYHFPAMSAVPISLEVMDRLCRAYPGAIAGVKDSSGSLDNMRAMIQRFPALSIFTGDDDFLLPLLRSGGAGSITAGANIAPHLLAHIYANWRGPDDAVEGHHAMLQNLWTGMLLKHPVTEALKEILAVESGNEHWLNMRAPLCRLPATSRLALLTKYREIGFTLIDSEREILERSASRR
jgi:4-hydroxy-tetrahydrodipicolinate synthase